MSKAALPDRYVVERRGTPDPELSEYYVLDVIHDRHARTALGRLVRDYQRFGQLTAAEELDELLTRTSAAHGKVLHDQYEAKSAGAKKASGTTRSRRK